MSVEKQCVLVEAPLELERHVRGAASLGAGLSGSGRRIGERRLYSATATAQRAAALKKQGLRLYANPRIRLPESGPIARSPRTSIDDLRTALRLDLLAERGLRGTDVCVAILDDGIHRASLEARLASYGFSVPKLDAGKRIESIPGPFSRGRRTHGTMCAFDVALACPACTLLDFPVNAAQAVVEPRIEDAIAVCDYLRDLLERGEVPSLVVVAAWQTLEKDEIDGIRTDDPEHPLYQALSALERAGADVLFSAPDHHAQFVHGPALHPGVLTVSAVDLAGTPFATAALGPATGTAKPDVVNYEGFLGYQMFTNTPDYGTSAATALTAGIVAALRSHPRVRGMAPRALREALRATARDVGPAGVDRQTGSGVIDVEKLLAWAETPSPRQDAREGWQPTRRSDRVVGGAAASAEKKRLLLFLVADLLSDDDVRDQFLQDPEGVMDRYELVGEQRCALFSLDPQQIGDVVAKEARETLENEVLSPNWPVPEARIDAVAPESVQRAVLGELRVRGENLMRGAEIILRPADFVGPELKFVAQQAEGPIQETTLSVWSADFTRAAPGSYQVAVRNCRDAELIESPHVVTVLGA